MRLNGMGIGLVDIGIGLIGMGVSQRMKPHIGHRMGLLVMSFMKTSHHYCSQLGDCITIHLGRRFSERCGSVVGSVVNS